MAAIHVLSLVLLAGASWVLPGVHGEAGLCKVTGDPHLTSFDGRTSNFQGACTYTLTRDNCKDGMPEDDPTFEVAAKYWRRELDGTVSWVKEVIVRTEGQVILLKQDGDVYLNGELLPGLPAQVTDTLRIYDRPNYLNVESTNGLLVQFDRVYSVRVTVDEKYAGELCGQCGDFDGNPDNDWVVGPTVQQCPKAVRLTKKPGSNTNNKNTFGYSWMYSEKDTSIECLKDCYIPEPTDPCSEEGMKQARQKCLDLFDEDGAFGKCLAELGEDKVDQELKDCVFDECHIQVNASVCMLAEQLAADCERLTDITVDWRTGTFCPPPCPENSEYTTCMKECQPDCDNPDADGCTPKGVCAEGCQCKEGFYYSNGTCIEPTKCGCVNPGNGALVPVKVSVVEGECEELCTCERSGGEMQCEPMKCRDDQECAIIDGVKQCACPPGYGDVDGKCRPSMVCSCSGDPHCHSFDGTKVDYHGTCKYVLAQDGCTDGLPDAKPTFQVLINNQRIKPKKKAARVSEVTVLFGEFKAEIVLKRGGTVYVNGEKAVLPYNFNDRYEVLDYPNYVHVNHKDTGLNVMWDREYSVRVTVPGDMFKQTCGICGPYNDDPADDKVMGPADQCMPDNVSHKPGDVITDDAILGNSWFHSMDKEDEFCEEDCETLPYPDKCESEKAKSTCAPLKNKNGPLKKCLAKLTDAEIESYYENCVFDTCILEEKTDKYACAAATDMVGRCSALLGETIEWRTSEFCSQDCPPNASYKTCASPCQATCYDPDRVRCDDTEECTEGCVCDPGFISYGDQCSPPAACNVQPQPCKDTVHPETGELYNPAVQCWKCKNAANDAECMANGKFETCLVAEAVCRVTKSKSGAITRGCDSFPKCEMGSIGEFKCDDKNTCTQCYYGTIDEQESSNPVFRCKPYVNRDVCSLKRDPGEGKHSPVTRFYFNQRKCKCQSFQYKGSGGNGNNFESKAACEERCSTWEIPDECLYELDRGTCETKTRMFYYNAASNKCKKFDYNGCDGNENRFPSKLACRKKCKKC